MIKKLVKTYYKLLDEKLENGTIVVLIICALIVSATFITDDTNANLLTKTNIIENNVDYKNYENFIEIDGKKYKITLEEIKRY